MVSRRRVVGTIGAGVALATSPRIGRAAEPVKVGVIGTLSGPFALYGKNFKAGVEAYVAQHGRSAGGHEVTFIWRDLDGPNPAQARALAQELVVKEKVQYLAGVVFTPNALAIAPILEEAQVPLVLFNAATSAIVEKSPLIVRSSFTLPQVTVPMARVAAERKIARVAVLVADYGPGLDSENAFKKTFEKLGGAVALSLRMPLKTTDFAPIMQRVRDAGPEAVFAFLPSGPPTLGFARAYIENGLKQQGIQLLTTGDVVWEPDLPNLGDAAIGILSTHHYAVSHDSPMNRAFVEAAGKISGSAGELAFPAVGAYDGTHLLYAMVEATGGRPDPARAVEAVKGLAWESPRGPVSVDRETRQLRQNIYLRTVERVGEHLVNREIQTFESQSDPGPSLAN